MLSEMGRTKITNFAIFCRICLSKGGFLSESAISFSNLQTFKKNIPKNYPELEI